MAKLLKKSDLSMKLRDISGSAKDEIMDLQIGEHIIVNFDPKQHPTQDLFLVRVTDHYFASFTRSEFYGIM